MSDKTECGPRVVPLPCIPARFFSLCYAHAHYETYLTDDHLRHQRMLKPDLSLSLPEQTELSWETLQSLILEPTGSCRASFLSCNGEDSALVLYKAHFVLFSPSLPISCICTRTAFSVHGSVHHTASQIITRVGWS